MDGRGPKEVYIAIVALILRRVRLPTTFRNLATSGDSSLSQNDHISTIDRLRAIFISCVLAHHIFAYTGFRIPQLDLNGALIDFQLFFLISGI